MLSLSQKESILMKKGVAIPQFPVRQVPRSFHFDDLRALYPQKEQPEDLELKIAVTRWQAGIELLYEVHIRRPVENAIQTVKDKSRSASDIHMDRSGPLEGSSNLRRSPPA